MSSLALFRAGKVEHELAVAVVVLVVALMAFLVYRGMKGGSDE